MKDFIFITGASGIGKTTLANGLLEQAINMVETTPSCFDYEYTTPPKRDVLFLGFCEWIRDIIYNMQRKTYMDN